MSTPLLEALEEHAAVLRAATQVYVGFQVAQTATVFCML